MRGVTTSMSGLTVSGGNGDDIPDSQNSGGGGLFSNGGNVTLSQCTFIRNKGVGTYTGSHIGGGGAVGNYNGGTLSVIGCTFTENYVDGDAMHGGGAILNLVSDAVIEDSTFTGNVSHVHFGGGGAIANIGNHDDGIGMNVLIKGCTFMGNQAVDVHYDNYLSGGAVHSLLCDTRIIKCEFTDNLAGTGGAVHISRTTVSTICNSRFVRNTAWKPNDNILSYGGAVHTAVVTSGHVIIVNCAFHANSAAQGGAAAFRNEATTCINCTMTANSATDWGGAIEAATSITAINLQNIICWGNECPNAPEIIGIEYCQVTHSCIAGEEVVPGINNTNAEPLFIDPDGPDDDPATWEDNNYRLVPNSPCVDTGDNALLPLDVFRSG